MIGQNVGKKIINDNDGKMILKPTITKKKCKDWAAVGYCW